jgi:D-alanine-D-alanine ligase-like ATP-grasp enzyme
MNIIQNVLSIISHIVAALSNIPKFVTPALLGALVAVFISPMNNVTNASSFRHIIIYLIEYDEDIIEQFYQFRIPEVSIFFQYSFRGFMNI